MINETKSKIMLLNFTNKHQFSTRLKIDTNNLEIINKTKHLGTIIQDDLKWDLNTEYLIKKANGRLLLLKKAKNVKASVEDLKQIYISFIRSILEYSCLCGTAALLLKM